MTSETRNRELDILLGAPKGKRRWWLWLALALAGTAVIAVSGIFLWMKFTFEAKAAAYDLQRIEDMESASVVYDRNRTIMGTIFIQNRDTIPLTQIPMVMQQAILAAEDARFYNHHGVDYIRVIGAALSNYRAGRITQGGSTITQQLARNSFGLRERSYERKLVEIFLANRIERAYPKSKILELYLNRIYFGGGLYGVEAASRGYFGKPAAELTLGEAAMLAGLIKSPNNFSPWSDRLAATRERDEVLARMLGLGMIKKDEYEQAKNSEPTVKSRRRQQIAAKSYAMDFIRQRVIAEVGFENAISEGYRVYTTIDLDLQTTAEKSLNSRLSEIESRTGYTHPTYASHVARLEQLSDSQRAEAGPPAYLQGAVLTLENSTGGIVTLVGGRDFAHSEYNRALQAKRPAGTAFTPLVFAAAFEKGIFPGRLFEDSALDNRQVMIGGVTGILGEWGPERMDNRYEGPMPARFALIKGKNAAAVRVGLATGLEKVIETARRSGISTELRNYPSTFLGSSEVTLADMVIAFSSFPNAGWRPESPFIIQRIERKDGSLIYERRPNRVQAMDERVAYQIHTALAESLEWGSADKATNRYGLKKIPAGGKTGTAYEFTDVWFLGYQSQITCGVWAGFDKPQPIYRGAFSSDVVLPVWVDCMNAATDRFPPRQFSQPAGLRRVEVDAKTGLLASTKSTESYIDPVSGRPMQRRNTFFELATAEQMPKDSYDNGAASVLVANRNMSESEWPRARLAVNLQSVQPVPIKEPTVIDPDPYGSVTPEVFAATSKSAGAASLEKAEEVRRAERIGPLDDPREAPAQGLLEAPPAIEF